MLLRRLRCDELGVCQARTPFCSGCFEVVTVTTLADDRKVGKIKPSLKEDAHGWKRSGSVPEKTVAPRKDGG